MIGRVAWPFLAGAISMIILDHLLDVQQLAIPILALIAAGAAIGITLVSDIKDTIGSDGRPYG